MVYDGAWRRKGACQMKSRLVAGLYVSAGTSKFPVSIVANAIVCDAPNIGKTTEAITLRSRKHTVTQIAKPFARGIAHGNAPIQSVLKRSLKRGRTRIANVSMNLAVKGTREIATSMRFASNDGSAPTPNCGAKSITPQRIVGARESRDRLAVTRARSGNSSSRSNAPNVRYAALPGSSKKTTVFRSRLAGLIWP